LIRATRSRLIVATWYRGLLAFVHDLLCDQFGE
jgi:hypothetical protein